jgi:hypothetical protein
MSNTELSSESKSENNTNNKTNQTYKIQYMNILFQKYKHMSYDDICNYIENDDNYEEYVNYMKCIEYLSKKEEERLFQEILQERRRLYALGLYELEEGEILE